MGGPKAKSRKCLAGELAVLDLHEIAGMHPIAAEEFHRLPPLPYFSAKRIPKDLLDQALSVRRFQVVPNLKGAGFLVITHLRFFNGLSELLQSKAKIQAEILRGLTAAVIRQRARADIYASVVADCVPISALPAIAEELEAEFPRHAGCGRVMGGKEMVARCFAVDIRRFHQKRKPRAKEMEHPEGVAA
jgi:hypothetical protein